MKIATWKLKEVLAEDRKLSRGLDPVNAILCLCARHTLLPEIFNTFGRDSVLSFLDRFGGKTIKVPSVKSVYDALIAITIWDALEKSNTPDTITRLAKRFSLKESEVKAHRNKVQEMLDAQERIKNSEITELKRRYLKKDTRKRAGESSIAATARENLAYASGNRNRTVKRKRKAKLKEQVEAGGREATEASDPA
jgi:phosphopantetheinyl transferase (holo-ACP synthase)